MTDPSPSAPARPTAGNPTTSRILYAVVLCLLVVHAAQAFAADNSWVAIGAFGACAAWMFGWRLDVLRSVRTAVVLLTMLSVACVLGTLTVQRSQIHVDSEEEYFETLAFAWAHLWIKATHPFPGEPELPDSMRAEFERTEVAFGEGAGDKKREMTVKGLQSAEDEAAATRLAASRPGFFRVFYRLSEAARLSDLHRAWWFIGLFYLLCGNLLFGAVIRRKPSLRNAGFHAAHLGLVFIVAGATAGAFTARRGVIPMTVGDSADQYILQEGGMGRDDLGFSVRLDRFDTLYHEDLSIELLEQANNPHAGQMGAHGNAPLTHTMKLEVGAELVLTDPATEERYQLFMEEITEGAALERTFRAGDSDTAPPAARLTLPMAGDEPFWMSADDGPYLDPAGRFKLRVERASQLPAADSVIDDACLGNPGFGTFTIQRDGAEAAEVRVVPGESFTYEGHTLTFDRVVPDFRVGHADGPPDEFPRNPALVAHIDGEEGMLFFFSAPRLKGFTTLPWDDFGANYDYDYWCSPAQARIQLQITPTGEAAAVVSVAVGEEEGPVTTVHAVAEGSAIELGPGMGAVDVATTVGTAVEHTELLPVTDADAAHAALRLRVVGPDGDSGERWLLSNTPDGAMQLGSGDTGFLVMLGSNTERPPRDWRSYVTVLMDDREILSEELEVNEPLLFRGHQLFQSDADPKRPEYSGLQVVVDPSWPLVHIGLWALMLGIAWCFYVQPLFDRRRKAAKEGSR